MAFALLDLGNLNSRDTGGLTQQLSRVLLYQISTRT